MVTINRHVSNGMKGKTGVLIHYQQEYKMVQSLWKTACQFLSKLKIDHMCVCVCELLSCVQLFVTPWKPCSPLGSSVHGILQQEYWSRLPFPSPRDLRRMSFIGIYPRGMEAYPHKILYTKVRSHAFPGGTMGKNQCRGPRFDSWSGN